MYRSDQSMKRTLATGVIIGCMVCFLSALAAISLLIAGITIGFGSKIALEISPSLSKAASQVANAYTFKMQWDMGCHALRTIAAIFSPPSVSAFAEHFL